ncbi:MAG: CDP-glycerol glycerophosphotransferase family protein [Clostridia bacterium]|nr:CDP-glycerol glycerophosphotransferase family protein [Clostridia bacterium]
MKELFYRLFALFFNISSALFSVKENRVTLLSPHNASFNDSLGEIRRELEDRGEFDFNLISHKDFASIVSALFFFTKKAYLLATSRYVFMNDNFMPLGYLNFRKETVVVQLWHAEGAFKKFGLDIDQPEAIRKREIALNKKLSFVICSGEGVRDIYASAFGVDKEKVLPLGSPRADVLLNSKNAAELRAAFEEKHPECKDRKIVLYAPTFRDDPECDRKFLSYFDTRVFNEKLGSEYVLLVRLHPQIHGEMPLEGVVDVTDYPSVNELTLISDILITDYSSICMDFVLLDKPCVFFAPDLSEYSSRRPFYFDYLTYVPGETVNTTAGLIEAVKNASVSERARAFKTLNLGAVDGGGAERIVNCVVGGK